jgi:hypothetical protein
LEEAATSMFRVVKEELFFDYPGSRLLQITGNKLPINMVSYPRRL